jgi:putative sporulation protein YtaF
MLTALLALSSNVDNFGVGMSYGVRRISLPPSSNLVVASLTAGVTFLTVLLGKNISSIINPEQLSKVGSFCFIIMGLIIMVRETRKVMCTPTHKADLVKEDALLNLTFIEKIGKIQETPLIADMDHSGDISVKEAFFLGCALSVNNAATGVAAGISGLNAFTTSAVVFIISILTLVIGILIGNTHACNWLGKMRGVFSGTILLCIGCIPLLS